MALTYPQLPSSQSLECQLGALNVGRGRDVEGLCEALASGALSTPSAKTSVVKRSYYKRS